MGWASSGVPFLSESMNCPVSESQILTFLSKLVEIRSFV
jgi:hypothetical protein